MSYAQRDCPNQGSELMRNDNVKVEFYNDFNGFPILLNDRIVYKILETRVVRLPWDGTPLSDRYVMQHLVEQTTEPVRYYW